MDIKIGRTEDCFYTSMPSIEAKNLFAKTAEKRANNKTGRVLEAHAHRCEEAALGGGRDREHTYSYLP